MARDMAVDNNRKDNSSRLPSLDGWRAVSIILVLGSHCTYTNNFPKDLNSIFNWLFDGDLGVRFFFVISGFLITYLLLKEYNQTGKISLQKFYIRRALRILPVYFAFLAVVFVLQIFTSWHQDIKLWLCNLTFLTNFIYHPGYGFTTGHLWSLAVEEQFYLVWPFLLVLIGQKGRKVFYVLGIPLVVAPIWRIISKLDVCPPIINPLFQWSSFFNYFDSLAIGCITAIFFLQHQSRTKEIFTRFKWRGLCLGFILLLTPYILAKFEIARFVVISIGPTLQAVGFAFLLLESILFSSLFKPLNGIIFSQLGLLSYSIYIWQEIFCTNPRYFGISNFWFMSFPGWLLAALLVATASYYGLEKPFMGLRAHFRKAG